MLDLFQVSTLINKQTRGKKKREGKREGERDLWTTRSENETGQDLDRGLSFMLAEEPIKLEQVNAVSFSERVVHKSRFPLSFPSLFFLRLFIDQERDL